MITEQLTPKPNYLILISKKALLLFLVFPFVCYSQDPSILRNGIVTATPDQSKVIELKSDTLKPLALNTNQYKKTDSLFNKIQEISNVLTTQTSTLEKLNSEYQNKIKESKELRSMLIRATNDNTKKEAEENVRKFKMDSLELRLKKIEGENALLATGIKLASKMKDLQENIRKNIPIINNLDKSIDAAINTLSYYQAKISLATSLLDSISIPKEKNAIVDNLATYHSNATSYKRLLERLEDRLQIPKEFFSKETIDALNIDTTKSVDGSQLRRLGLTFRFNNREFEDEGKSLAALQKDYNEILRTKDTLSKNIDATFRKINESQTKVTESESEVGALPSLTSTLGDLRQLNLNINVLASFKTPVSKDVYVSVEGRLFTTNSAALSSVNMKSFFLPEASPFGFQLKTILGRRYQVADLKNPDNKKIIRGGLTGQLNFLTKKFASIDTLSKSETFSIFFVHPKIGAEIVLIEKTLGLYANRNWIVATDNLEDFEKNFLDKRKNYKFWEVGLRGLFGSKSVKQGLSLSIDLAFVIADRLGRDFIQTRDKAYPVFRFGVLKSLGALYN